MITGEQKRVIDFAGQRWNHPGNQADAIRAEFGLSVTRYWQKVNQLLDDPEALAYSPTVVNRLRRLRTR